MKRIAFALASAAVLALPARAQVKDTTIRLDALVAMVGNTPITVYDVERRVGDSLQALMRRQRPIPATPEARRELILGLMNEIVEEEVLLAKAKEAGVEVDETQIAAMVDGEIRRQTAGFPNQAQFRQALEQAGLGTPEEYRRTMLTNVRRSETIRKFVSELHQDPDKKIASVVVPESKVREEYEKLKASGQLMRSSFAVGWRQMVIAPKPSPAAKAAARAKIDSLRDEIRAGGDFERVAKRESMDPGSKDLGGDLGWRKRGDLAIELEVFMFGARALRQGEVSQVIESPFGFHLLRIDRANPPAEVKARHILIMPKIDSADVERARVLADSLAREMRRGVVFDSIARVYHDRAEDAPGLIPEQPLDSLPASYQAGLKDVKKDSIVTFPIPTAMGYSKFVIAAVTSTSEPGDLSYEQVSPQLRFQLQNIGQMRKYIDDHRGKTVYVRTYPERSLEALRIFPPG